MPQEEDTFSDYLGITKPAFEKDPFDSDYYELVDKVDEVGVPQGPVSERPSAPSTTRLWFDTDNEHLTRWHPGRGEWTVPDPSGRANVRDYGAVGDGSTDDFPAAQAAADQIRADEQPATLYFPPGRYYLDGELDASGIDNLTVSGAGRYQSIIEQPYDSDDPYDRCVTLSGNHNEICHLGVDASDRPWDPPETRPTTEFARIAARNSDNIYLHNLWGHQIQHLVDVRDCQNVQISHLHAEQGFNAAHIIRCGTVKVSDIIADRTTTVVDFAGGVDRATVTGCIGDGVVIDRGEEAIDAGGVKKISLSDCVFDNFSKVLQLKNEGGESWESADVSNVHGYRIEDVGFNINSGGLDVALDGVSVRPGGGENCDGINVGDASGVSLRNVNISVDGTAIVANNTDELRVENGKVTSYNELGVDVTTNSENDVRISDLDVRCSDGSDAEFCVIIRGGRPRVNSVEIDGSRGVGGLRLTNCRRPSVNNSTIKNIATHGVYLNVDDSDVVGSVDAYLGWGITNTTVRDWGVSGGEDAIRLINNINSGARFRGVDLTGNTYEISNSDRGSQTGVNFRADRDGGFGLVNMAGSSFFGVPTALDSGPGIEEATSDLSYIEDS